MSSHGLPVCPPICLSVCLSVCLSTCSLASAPACLSIHPSICLSACLPACLPECLPICLYVYLSAYLSVCLSVCLPACLPACLSVLSYLCVYPAMSETLLAQSFNFVKQPIRYMAIKEFCSKTEESRKGMSTTLWALHLKVKSSKRYGMYRKMNRKLQVTIYIIATDNYVRKVYRRENSLLKIVCLPWVEMRNESRP